MTVEYQPSTTTGTVSSWKRAAEIIITDPVLQTPTVVFLEEIANMLPSGSVVTEPSTQIVQAVTDMTVTFNLLDPTSGDVVGTMNFGELYAAVYSMYIYLATARDAANAAAAAAMASSNS